MSNEVSRELEIDGARVPTFLYGTAWKEDATQSLTEAALRAGFKGIDTANQRKHYHEAGVGEGVAAAIDRGEVTREGIFLQTKFTFQPGQDHRLPYDPRAPIAEQVAQSFAKSLEHLRTTYIDAYVLHGPMQRHGLGDADWSAWRAMESLHRAGSTRLLGVSNVSRDQLEALCADAEVRPRFVQNRCYARLGWDREVREVCVREGIRYQGFSLLTANARELNTATFREVVRATGLTPAQVVFRFALQLGMLPLTGTTDPAHMAEDLAAYDREGLSAETVTRLEQIATA